MTISRCAAVLIASLGLASPLLAGPSQPDLLPAPVEKVFVPLGFDANDNAEVAAHGHFVSSCFKVGPATGSVDYESRTVTLEITAYTYPGLDCAQVLVPFTSVVSLGTVRPGSYRVVVKDRPEALATSLEVAEATTSGPDEFLYAPVEQASLATSPDGTRRLTVEGTYPYTYVGCMKMKEVRTYRSPGNVLVVQPIAALTEGEECAAQAATKVFRVTTPVREPLDAGEYLLHVRALSGRSVNRVVDLGGLD